MASDSVGIMEDVADDEQCGVSIRYYSVTHNREETITSCEGDMIVICNVLADYADLLDGFLQTDRCRKITESLQKKTGYDRNAAIEKCRRKAGRKQGADAGIGEDALVLSARRRAGAPQKTEQPAAENKKTE